MESIWASLIATVGSLLGVSIGIVSAKATDRSQDRRSKEANRQAAATAVADELVSALKQLRHLPEEHFEEAAVEVYLPRYWYEQYEPSLLRKIGDVSDAAARLALRDIVVSLGDSAIRPLGASVYHYVERQLLLALEIAHSFKRSEPLEAETDEQLAELRQRIDSNRPL